MGQWMKKNRSGLLLMVLAFTMIGTGIYRNEVATVFQKATAICLECIGIG